MQFVPGGQHGLPGRGRRGRRGRHRRGADPGRARTRARSSSCAGDVDVGRPRSTSSSSASESSTRRVGQRAGAGERQVERTAATLPRHEAAGLLGGRRDRQDDVGVLGHRARADLEADDEADPLERFKRAGRVGQVGRVEAADDQRRQRAVAGRGDDRVDVAAGADRDAGVPDPLDLDARGVVRDRTATGQQASAGRRRRSRRPRRPVGGPRPASRRSSRPGPRRPSAHRATKRAAHRRGSTAPSAESASITALSSASIAVAS